MKKNRIIVFVVVVIVVALIVVFIVLKPITHYRAQQIMERQIPEAINFVHEHENELSVIQELQGRLIGIGYRVQQMGDDDATLHVLTHSPGAVSIGSIQSFKDCSDMSEAEKDAINEVLSALYVTYKDVYIEPDGITIYGHTYFGFNLFYTNTVSLNLSDSKSATTELSNRENYYYEWINDKWLLEIWYWQND